jgi:hypothetical protein
MPVCERKLSANRANAVKSRGPITPQGKRNSSRNNMRHGLLSNSVLIEGESPERFAALLNSLYTEHEPATERILVEKMAVAQWRQRRLWTVDSTAITQKIRRQSDCLAAETPPIRTMHAIRAIAENGRHADLMSRYEHRFDRRYYHALEALDRPRTTGKTAPCPAPEPDPEIARAIRSHRDPVNRPFRETADPTPGPFDPTADAFDPTIGPLRSQNRSSIPALSPARAHLRLNHLRPLAESFTASGSSKNQTSRRSTRTIVRDIAVFVPAELTC